MKKKLSSKKSKSGEKIKLTEGLNTSLNDKQLIQLVNQLDICFFITDRSFKIKMVNKVFTDLTGFTEKQLKGKSMLRFLSKLNEANVINAWKKEPYKDNHRVILEFKNKKGKYFFYINTYRKYSSRTLYVIKLTDYTETARYIEELNVLNHLSDLNIQKLHKANENLKDSQEAERQAIVEKELFFSKISHELRTPIGGILGISGLLKEMVHDDEQKRLISGIMGSASHLNGVVSDLLDFNKMNSGNFALHKQVFNIKNSINNFFTLFEKGYTNRHISAGLIIDDTIPEWISGDEQRLRQVFYNLLSNAFKFTEKGEVIFSVKKLSESPRKVKVLFKVEDNGKGIPESEQGKVFEPYHQALGNNAYGIPGTGLGLSICRQLINLHGGKIYFESKEGVGTTFYIEIEFEKAKEKFLDKLNDVRETPLLNSKILVADDNEINQLYFSTLLKSKGADVIAVNHGKEMLHFLDTQSVDLILLDVQMPVMGGMEALTILREERKSKIPVIIISAYVSKVELERFNSAGANGYLQKPTNEDELLNTISICLNRPQLKVERKKGRKDAEVTFNKFKIDTTIIKNISGDDAGFYKDFLAKISQQLNEQYQMIKAAQAEENFEVFKRTAHQLKSSFRYLGREQESETLNTFEEFEDVASMLDKKVLTELQKMEKSIQNCVICIKEELTLNS